MADQKAVLAAVDEMLNVMEDPNCGVPTQEDPYWGTDYDEDLYDAFDQNVPDGGPEASLWRVIIAPSVPRAMSKGGIALPHQVREAEEHLNYLGRVVHVGPLAGQSPKFHIIMNKFLYWITGGHFGWKSAWNYKVGDLILYGRYTGQKIFFKGARLILMNDDSILGHAESPRGYKIYAG